MIKQTMAALLLTTSVASAADMMDDMMKSGLEDQNVVSLNYNYIESDFDQADGEDFVTLELDGRNGLIEYGASVSEEYFGASDVELNVGLVVPVVAGFGVAAGVDYIGFGVDDDDAETETLGGTNEYVAVVYDAGGKFEGRVQYNTEFDSIDDTDSTEVSGRYWIKDNFGINAGVEAFGSDSDELTWTTGISYKF